MRIESLSLEGFRNIERMKFSPCGGVNVIFGDNAQGKTNLLEAVWLFSGARSFRSAKETELVGFGRDFARLDLSFFAGGRSQTASLRYGENRKDGFLNEVKLDRIPSLAGEFCVVVFSPDHLSLIKDGPEKRRRMIDASLLQAYPKYGKVLDSYTKSLSQRNRLLKDIGEHASLLDTLDIWDKNLIEYGAYISRMRDRYVRRVAELAGEFYRGISRGRESFSAAYLPSFGESAEGFGKEDYRNAMEQAVRESRAADIRLGSTSVGPHRDDMEIRVDGVSARSFGSQGQQRSCVLSLKLAECQILEDRWGEPPVVLLDDVMSELDEGRRLFLLNQLDRRQVFITCCDNSAFEGLEGGRVFRIRGGCLKEEDPKHPPPQRADC